MDILIIVIGSVLGAGGIATAIIQGIFGKRKIKAESIKTHAEAAAIVADTALRVSQESTQRYSDIVKHVEIVEEHLSEARKQIAEIRNQLSEEKEINQANTRTITELKEFFSKVIKWLDEENITCPIPIPDCLKGVQ